MITIVLNYPLQMQIRGELKNVQLVAGPEITVCYPSFFRAVAQLRDGDGPTSWPDMEKILLRILQLQVKHTSADVSTQKYRPLNYWTDKGYDGAEVEASAFRRQGKYSMTYMAEAKNTKTKILSSYAEDVIQRSIAKTKP